MWVLATFSEKYIFLHLRFTLPFSDFFVWTENTVEKYDFLEELEKMREVFVW